MVSHNFDCPKRRVKSLREDVRSLMCVKERRNGRNLGLIGAL